MRYLVIRWVLDALQPAWPEASAHLGYDLGCLSLSHAGNNHLVGLHLDPEGDCLRMILRYEVVHFIALLASALWQAPAPIAAPTRPRRGFSNKRERCCCSVRACVPGETTEPATHSRQLSSPW